MSERMKFVVRAEAGEPMTDLCLEFGISRKTGYKIVNRYRELGPVALLDESRAPERIPHRTPEAIEDLIVEARRKRPTWGPKKLRKVLTKKYPELRLPSEVTFGAILIRRGIITGRRRQQRHPRPAGHLRQATAPNDLWCADFKGEFRLGDRSYCYPLTITDRFSRFIIACEGLETTRTEPTRSAFELAFREFGLPAALRTDNGPPFASRGLGHLTRFSVWLLRLGIQLERIEPAHPEQNGQHERMHRTLKQETTRPAAETLLRQQERFDLFVDDFNRERPHEALNQQTPADFYRRSERAFPSMTPDLSYPLHDEVRLVRRQGDIRFRNGSLFLSEALAGEHVGLRELDEARWLVSFMSFDLGVADSRTRKLQPLPILLDVPT